MGRLFLLLVVAGLGWWAYESWFATPSHAAAEPASVARTPLEDLGDGRALRADDAPPETAQASSAGEPGADDEAVERFVAALRAGDARARAHGFAIYAKTKDPADRQRIGDALAELVADVPPAEAVGVLGEDNSFLHTELGRRCAVAAAARVGSLPGERALSASSRLLEAAMNGSITRADEEAIRTVDGVYAKHLDHVSGYAFNPSNAARARRYEVRPGDNLDRIAHRFREAGINVEAGTLMVVNRIRDPRRLRVGQVLRIPIDPIRCVAHRESFLMAVYLGDAIVRLYWMAHGKEGEETPATEFVVEDKIPNPDWDYGGERIPFGDPRNPLGRLFVKLRHPTESGFGVHGTNEPETIGTRASLGCLRLAPDAIEEFARLVPRKAVVEIR